jgi:UDP-glucose 4-epimerase
VPNVIVTGSEGFIGQYVTKKFLDEGYRVLGIDNLSKYGERKNPNDSYYALKELDLTNPNCKRDIKAWLPQIVIDLAEDVGGIGYLNANATDKLKSSLLIRHNILDSIKKSTRYVCISSSAVYERVHTFPTPEIDVLDLPTPYSPYALSKLNAEYLSMFSAGNVVVARLFNVAGKGDDHPEKGHVIADLVRKFKNCGGKPVYLNGDGSQIRNFTHGEDVAKALYLISQGPAGQIYNVGSHNNMIIWDLAVKIAERVGISSGLGTTDNPIFNIHKSMPNISRLENLGYKPKWDIEKILDEAVEYYV